MAEASMVDVLAALEEDGFTSQFGSRPGGMVQCMDCRAEEPAAQTPVLAMHRLEGATDPSDEAIVVALECVSCGQRGTLVLSYGPESSAEDAGVLADLIDERDHA